MKCLFLGYNRDQTQLISKIEQAGYVVDHCDTHIKSFKDYDVVISFGYRKIIPLSLLETSSRPIINFHISYLPYNRGAHPNFWSCVENTPSGVTIHEIDESIDTGPIVAQKLVSFEDDSISLSESFAILISSIEQLFIDNLKSILEGTYSKKIQSKKGTYHKKSQLPEWLDSWDISRLQAREYWLNHEK